MDSMDVRCRACDFVHISRDLCSLFHVEDSSGRRKQCIDIGVTCELFNIQQIADSAPSGTPHPNPVEFAKKPLIRKVVPLYRWTRVY